MQKNNTYFLLGIECKKKWRQTELSLFLLLMLIWNWGVILRIYQNFLFFSCNLLIFPSRSFFLIRGKAVCFSSISLASCYFYSWLQVPIWTLSMFYSFLDSHPWIFLIWGPQCLFPQNFFVHFSWKRKKKKNCRDFFCTVNFYHIFPHIRWPKDKMRLKTYGNICDFIWYL